MPDLPTLCNYGKKHEWPAFKDEKQHNFKKNNSGFKINSPPDDNDISNHAASVQSSKFAIENVQ